MTEDQLRTNLEAWRKVPAEEQARMMHAGPGVFDKLASFATAVVEHAKDGLRTASSEVQAERERICRACPESEKDATACKACGCGVSGALSFVGLNMTTKRSLASSRCPLREPRWSAV